MPEPEEVRQGPVSGAAAPYRVGEVAELMNAGKSTVYRLIESGELPAFRAGSGRGGLRVPREAYEKFVRARAVRPPDASPPEAVA